MKLKYSDTINEYLNKHNIVGLTEFLNERMKEGLLNNDLYYMLSLVNMYRVEQDKDLTGVFDYPHTAEEYVDIYRKFRRLIRKAEWCEECYRNDILLFMGVNHISVIYLYWVVQACCIDKDRVWELIVNG